MSEYEAQSGKVQYIFSVMKFFGGGEGDMLLKIVLIILIQSNAIV